MALGLASIRDQLYPGLAEVSRRVGRRFTVYQEFNRDVLVIKFGDPGDLGNQTILEITRAEIEDNRHLPKLRFFLETLMCVKVAGSVTAPPPQAPSAIENQFYDAFALTRAAVADNLFLQEITAPAPAPAKPSWPPAPELIMNDESDDK